MDKKKRCWTVNDGHSFSAELILDPKEKRVIISTFDCGVSEILLDVTYAQFLEGDQNRMPFRYFDKKSLKEVNDAILLKD